MELNPIDKFIEECSHIAGAPYLKENGNFSMPGDLIMTPCSIRPYARRAVQTVGVGVKNSVG